MEALILSCGTGGGHNAAGKALEEEWKKRGYQVTFLNPYTLKSERMAKIIDYLYVDIVQKTPLLFGIIYQIGNLYRKLPVKSPVYYINGKMTGPLYRYLEEKKPDVILMPHLYPAEIITQMKAQGYPLPCTLFVGTDYTCIPFTEETDCDYYMIPAADLKKTYIERGMNPEKLYPYGIPVSGSFAARTDRQALRKSLRLRQDRKYIIVTGGSMGAGNLKKAVELLHVHYRGTDKKIIVICGNNKKLYRQLKKRYGKTMRILLYTDKMADYMKACDLLLSKPGGLSSTEAAVAEIPLIHITPIPGCETLNMQYFQEKGMSVAMPVIEERLCTCCDRLLAEDGERQKERQRRHISKRAAGKICDFVEEKARQGQTGR